MKNQCIIGICFKACSGYCGVGVIKNISNYLKIFIMKKQLTFNFIILLLLFRSLISCAPGPTKNDYLVSFTNTITNEYGYKNLNGDTIIPQGKYEMCFTDTFKTYAIVVKPNGSFIAIDRQENVLYGIFPYDNGPDYPSEGLFRILQNNKIGYADSITGKIVIKPQFDCAWPFENGIAKVSNDCKTQMEGEHSFWVSDHWFYIDKSGKKVEKPKQP